MPIFVQVTIQNYKATYAIWVGINEYRSLMQLITDRIYVDGFGKCKGVGRCETCLINVLK